VSQTKEVIFQLTGPLNEPCISGAVCDEVGMEIKSLKLMKGFWRASAISKQVFECPRPLYCEGGGLNVTKNNNRRLLYEAQMTLAGLRKSEDDALPSSDGVFMGFVEITILEFFVTVARIYQAFTEQNMCFMFR
jgi:hypothetical protein